MIQKLYLTFLLISTLKCDSSYESSDGQCEPIKGECNDLGYTFTTKSVNYENSFATQEAADAKIRSFDILMPCSNYLKIFLCGTYKPSCYDEPSLIVQPCKSMCEHVYARCFPLMDKFKKKWSPELNCSKFLDDDSLSCMNDKGYKKDLPFGSSAYIKQIDLLFERVGFKAPPSSSKSNIDNFLKDSYGSADYDLSKQVYGTEKSLNSTKTNRASLFIKEANLNSDSYLKNYICLDENSQLKRSVNTSSSAKCLLRCDANVWFSLEQKQLAQILIVTLSIVCFLSSLFTIIRFLCKRKKCKYPMLALVFVSMCNTVYSFVSLIGVYVGKEMISCHQVDSDKSLKPEYAYFDKPLENGYCSIVLLVNYYFRLASLNWWFIIAFSWFLIVQFNLNVDKVSRYGGSYFHLIAWSLPALETILILLARTADISELTGLCSVGSQDSDSLLKYIILPSSIYLILGLILILISSFKMLVDKSSKDVNSIVINKYKKPDDSIESTSDNYDANSSQNDLIRCGVIVSLCSLPHLVMLTCELYEYFSMDHWIKLPVVFNYSYKQKLGSDEQSVEMIPNRYYEQPNLIVFLVKTSMPYLNGLFVLALSLLGLKVCDVFECGGSKAKSESAKSDSSESTSTRSINHHQNTIRFQSNHIAKTQTPNYVRNILVNNNKCDCKLNSTKSTLVMHPIDLNQNNFETSYDLHEFENGYPNFIKMNMCSSAVSTPNGHHYCTPNILLENPYPVIQEYHVKQQESIIGHDGIRIGQFNFNNSNEVPYLIKKSRSKNLL